ncbi:MAG TPA: sigma factor-like helix-turn-helix DNA-binding protein [Myxococcota bacterium]
MVSLNLGRRTVASSTPAALPKKRLRRPKTVSLRRMTRERGKLPIVDDVIDVIDDVGGGERLDADTLPATRSACRRGPRPCPFVSCRFHLYLDVNPKTGSIKINFPDREPWDLDVSCALDVAEARGGMSLDELGKLLNLTRERARQLEQCALHKIGDVVGGDDR